MFEWIALTLSIVVLSTWTGLTICAQFLVFSRTKHWVDRSTLLRKGVRNSFVPRWTFFAPDPLHESVHLVWRVRTEEEYSSQWIVSELMKRNSRRAWVWNPESRLQGVVSLATQELRRDFSSSSLPLHLSENYICLLGLASEEASHTRDGKIQFAVLYEPANGSDTGLRPLLVSHFHDKSPIDANA